MKQKSDKITEQKSQTTSKTFHEKIKDVWRGTADKNVFQWHLILTFSIYIFGIIYGCLVYTGGFSINHVYISYLGSPDADEDIRGAFVYNTTVLIAGIMLIPYFLFMYRRLSPVLKFGNILAWFFGTVGSLGFAGLSIFHQGGGIPENVHETFTYIAFGGFGASSFFMLFVLIRKRFQTQTWPKIWRLIVIYGICFGIIAYINIFSSDNHFQEWGYLSVVIIWILGTFWMTK